MVLRGPSFGDVYYLDGEDMTLGSDPFRADVVVRDVEVQPMHARVYRDGAGYALRNLDTGKGTALNESAVEEVSLGCGDRVFLGDTVLEFVEGDPLREQFHETMQRLINEDYLTGLMAKNRFDDHFEHSLGIARDAGQPLSILMADIDNLKKINDRHGHLTGEYVVAEVGTIIRAHLPNSGCFATRFGGDEYQAVLPGATRDAALETAEKLRHEVERYAFERDGDLANPTISVGVSAFPTDGDIPSALTRAADEALYRAKKRGGNIVCD